MTGRPRFDLIRVLDQRRDKMNIQMLRHKRNQNLCHAGHRVEREASGTRWAGCRCSILLTVMGSSCRICSCLLLSTSDCGYASEHDQTRYYDCHVTKFGFALKSRITPITCHFESRHRSHNTSININQLDN